MGQVIGKNSLDGSGAAFNLTSTKLLRGVSQQATLQANQKIIEMGVAWLPSPTNGTGSSSVRVCLYDLSNNTMIPGTEVAIPYNGSTLQTAGVATHVKATGLSIDISAHSGKTVGIGLAPPSQSANSGFKVAIETVAGAIRENGTVQQTTNPATFTVATTVQDTAWGVYVVTEDITPPETPVSLDSLSDTTLSNGETVTATLSGNGATGTVSLISGAITVPQTVNSWTYNAGTNKTTVVFQVAQGGIKFGAATVRISTSVALDAAVTVSPGAGNSYVNIVSPKNTPGYIFEQLESGTYTNADQVEATDSPNTVITAEGAIQQAVVRNFQARARDSQDNTWSTFSTITPYPYVPGPGPDPAPDLEHLRPLKAATQYNVVSNNTLSIASPWQGMVGRVPHRIGGGDVTHLALIFEAWYISAGSTGLVTSIPNDYTIHSAVIEWNGTAVPLTFSGIPTRSVVSGETHVLTDELDIQAAFGQAVIPYDAEIFVKYRISVPAFGNVLPMASPRTSALIPGTQFFRYNADSVLGSDTAPGNWGTTGALTITTAYTPMVVGRHVREDAVALFAHGDSITVGANDAGASATGHGWLGRALALFPTKPGLFNFGVSGSMISAGSTDPKLVPYYGYCNVGTSGAGTNDFNFNGTSSTVAAALSRQATVIGRMKDNGIRKVGIMALMPRGGSTDSFATLENQTPVWTSGMNPDVYNQTIRAGGYDAVIQQNVVRAAEDPFKWIVDGTANKFTQDGIHPRPPAYLMLAAEAKPVLETLISAAITPVNYTSATSGNWNDTDTWTPSGVPTNIDAATIGPGHTVTVPVGFIAKHKGLTLSGSAGNQAALTVLGEVESHGDIVRNEYAEITGDIILNGYSIIEPEPEPEIISVGANGVIKIDSGTLSATNAINTRDFGTLTGVTISTPGAGSYAAVALNAPDGDGTFVAPFWKNNASAPYLGSVEVTATDGTNVDSIGATLAIPDGYQARQFASLAATSLQHLQYWMTQAGRPLVNGERIYFPTASSFSVSAASLVTAPTPGDYTAIIHRADFRTEMVKVRVGAGGFVVGIGNAPSSGGDPDYQSLQVYQVINMRALG